MPHPRTRSTTPVVAPAEWLAMAGVACLGVAALSSPSGIEDGPVICPFRLITGLPCPGCGMTRAWVYGLHGEWASSWASHPFALLAIGFAIALAIVSVVRRVKRVAPVDLNRLARHPITLTVLGAWLSYALVRLVLAAT